jgi:hypothetical protein
VPWDCPRRPRSCPATTRAPPDAVRRYAHVPGFRFAIDSVATLLAAGEGTPQA